MYKYLCGLLDRNTHTHKENIMSKSPYEIRLELLKLANEITVTPIFQKREALLTEYNSKLTDDNRDKLSFPTLPDFPSINDIISKAEELNRFVSQN